MLSRDGDDVGQPAAAKQAPLLIRDAALLAEGKRRQQRALTQILPAGGGPGQPALAQPRLRRLNLDHPAQVAGGGDPLAEQQAPPIHSRLVGQAVGRFERDHQREATACRHGGQRLVGIDAHQRRRSERLLVEPVHPQHQPDKFIALGFCTLQLCGYDVARFFCQADPARQAGNANSPASRGCRTAKTAAASSGNRPGGTRAAASGHPIPMKATMAKAVKSLPRGQTTTDADPWCKYLARFQYAQTTHTTLAA